MSETATTKKRAAKKPEAKLGLLESVDYEFDSSGRVNWKAMIKKEHIVLNREACIRAGYDIDNLSEEELEKVRENESLLLIKLQGFKELALLRGVKKMIPKLVNISADNVAVEYEIEFTPNFENPDGLVVKGLANANFGNTDGDFKNYLEPIAENRALVRAVKTALGINILGQDELPSGEVQVHIAKEEGAKVTDALAKLIDERGISFSDIKDAAVKKGDYPGADKWKSVHDIPQAQAMMIFSKMKKKK